MATTEEFINYVCSLIKTEHFVRYKKMFGEYLIYVNEKPIVLVCDNTVYVKNLDYLKEFLKNNKLECPYNGAKPHYVINIEDVELFNDIIKLLEINTVVRHKKKKS